MLGMVVVELVVAVCSWPCVGGRVMAAMAAMVSSSPAAAADEYVEGTYSAAVSNILLSMSSPFPKGKSKFGLSSRCSSWNYFG